MTDEAVRRSANAPRPPLFQAFEQIGWFYTEKRLHPSQVISRALGKVESHLIFRAFSRGRCLPSLRASLKPARS